MPLVLTCPNCQEDVSMPDTDFSALMCPHCLAEFTIKPVMQGKSGEQGGGQAAGKRQIEIGDDDEEAEADEQEIVIGSPASGTGAGGATSAAHATHAQPTSTAGRSSYRPRRKGPGLKAHLVGVVGGGVLGLAVGYYLLNYIGGPKFNFLDIPLPGIEHTQRDGGGRAASDQGELADPRGAGPSRPLPGIEQPRDPSPPARANEPAVTPKVPVTPQDPGTPKGNGRPTRPAPPAEPTYYSADELGAAAALAKQALEKSRAGISADAYRRLCRLAEMVTFADPADGGVPARQGEVILALQAATNSGERIDGLGAQAATRLGDENRLGDGLVLAGTVTAAEQRGEYHLLQLALANGGKPATVVSRSPAGFKSGDRVVIAGVIVDQPGQQFPGTRWSESRVVLGGMPLRLR